jgi:hypothetical protein
MSKLNAHFSLRDPRLGSVSVPTYNVQTVTTAGAHTYTTDEILSGLIIRDTNGASRSDVLPTAVDLVAAVQGAMVNHAFEVEIRNNADASAEVLTITAGTGGTTSGTMTVADGATKRFAIVFTAVTLGSEAYTVFSLGSKTY